MDDNSDIAFLAASCNRSMQQLNIPMRHPGSTGLGFNRTDFRQFLHPSQQQPNNPYPQHPMYPQQVYVPGVPPPNFPQQHPGNIPVDPNIPEGHIPPSNAPLIPMPQGYGPPLQHVRPPVMNPDGSVMQPVDGFHMPDYTQPPPKQYLEDEQEFRDALIKEVKEQKKNINKLLREMKSLILLVKEMRGNSPSPDAADESPASSEPPIDDTSIKS